jgi:hypothetical protein
MTRLQNYRDRLRQKGMAYLQLLVPVEYKDLARQAALDAVAKAQEEAKA